MINILFDGESQYSRYRIVERIYNNRPSRLLLAGQTATPQSGIALDDEAELLFEYNQRLFEIALSLQPRSVLVIGGGAFTLPTVLVERLAVARVDVVEIDPLLPRLARKHFSLPRTSKLNIFIQDGRSYIDNCNTSYDLIIVDAFSEYDIPRSLLTVEAAKQYARLLAPGGTLALNIIARYTGDQPTLVHHMMASFEESFGTIEIYPADPDDEDQQNSQNLIFIASNKSSPSLDYLQSVRVYPNKLQINTSSVHD